MLERTWFARAALAEIPKILTLGDRNPHSPTYGCFDRGFWQYKVLDFPCGMSQEFVFPLALAWALDIPGNPFFQEPNLKTWATAGLHYMAQSAHPDGSCDDYFPFERASGAAAFSLLAGLESYALLGLDDPDLIRFFERRATWLAHHQESGRLTNHQALIVLCLELLGRLTRSDRFRQDQEKRLELVLSWQSSEGWFYEYEGCDPGYHSLTISCLAWLHELQQRRDDRLTQSLLAAVKLSAEFIHPDGSVGGEYTSRNTYNFFPYGFELVGRWHPAALAVNDRALAGLAAGKSACYSDDRLLAHHAWNYLLAWRDFVDDRPTAPPPQPGRVWLPQAKLLVDRRRDPAGRLLTLYVALNKGGAFKLFRDDRLLVSDTQWSLLIKTGKKTRNLVGHLVGDYDISLSENGHEIRVRGKLGPAKQTQMTPLKLLILRLGMLSVGRFFPDLVRRVLQKMLIVGKSETQFQFTRSLTWTGDTWAVADRLRSPDWSTVQQAAIGTDGTSIYVVMSRTFQSAQLQPWLDLTAQVRALRPGEALSCDRSWGDSG